jgi:hypothetical protein
MVSPSELSIASFRALQSPNANFVKALGPTRCARMRAHARSFSERLEHRKISANSPKGAMARALLYARPRRPGYCQSFVCADHGLWHKTQFEP